jgi:MFS family permease
MVRMEPAKSTFIAVRAIGAEFARRTLKSLVLSSSIALVILLLVTGWLITRSSWWWILFSALLLAAVLIIIAAIVAYLALRVAEPTQTNAQKLAVRTYVDKLQRVAENLQTPQFIIAYRVVRDTAHPRQDSFIETVSRDSKGLGPDFAAIIKLFS